MPPELSIVIPTHRRETLLKLLLDSLVDQTVKWDRFEVVVVDNSVDPYPPTQELCRSSRYEYLSLKCVHNPVLGAGGSRNFGFQRTCADWVAFIDDDEKLPVYWIERAMEIIEKLSPDIFGGPYHPFYLDPKPSWFKDQYLRQDLGTQPAWLTDNNCLLGGNIVFKRPVFAKLGGFPTNIGPKGGNVGYGDETELQLRAHRMGARFYYDPELFAHHYAHPSRMKAQWFLDAAWVHGRAKAQIYLTTHSIHQNPVRYSLSMFKKFVLDAFKVIRRYLEMPWRDRKTALLTENYLVQSVAPAISVMAMSWFLFAASLKPGRKGK